MRITSKGQVTIPQEIREKFGLLENTEIEFVVEGKTVKLVKVKKPKKESRGTRALQKLRGRAEIRLSTDDIMALTRDR